MNAIIAGIVGGFLAVAASKLLEVIAVKLKLIPEWIEDKTGWVLPGWLHSSFDSAVDIGVSAANAFRTKAFWATAVNCFRKGRTEEALQAFLTVLKNALVSGASSVKVPQEWQSIWNEIRRDVATVVSVDAMTPRLSLMAPKDAAQVKAVLANPTLMTPILEAKVNVAKHEVDPPASENTADIKAHLEKLIEESKARQASMK